GRGGGGLDGGVLAPLVPGRDEQHGQARVDQGQGEALQPLREEASLARPGGPFAGNHVVVGFEAQPAIVVTGQDEGYGRLFGGRPPVEVVEDARVVEQRAPAPVARLGGVRRFIEVVGG